MKKSLSNLGAFVAFILLLASCDSKSRSCNDDSDCPAGLQCVLGSCLASDDGGDAWTGGDTGGDAGDDFGTDAGADGEGGVDPGPDEPIQNCSGNEVRCLGSIYQVCQNGTFVEAARCDPPQMCTESLGCADCDPAQGNACHQGDVYSCNANGTIGSRIQECLTERCVDGQCGDPDCPPETQLIYVVDDEYRLLSFSPIDNQFRLIGTLACQAGSSWPGWGQNPATPFSMGVDRTARAWVLYTSGEIFYVDTFNAVCTRSQFQPGQLGFELFGMGFVSDAVDSIGEKLYIGGGPAGSLVTGDMGFIDPVTLQVTRLGDIPPEAEYAPELTGTGSARWFGYFPGISTTFVAELKKNDGQINQEWDLPGLPGEVHAWAFAHWGGKFYVFVTTGFGSENSQVLRLDPATGLTETLLSNQPYAIVGAGVSTCAPYE